MLTRARKLTHIVYGQILGLSFASEPAWMLYAVWRRCSASYTVRGTKEEGARPCSIAFSGFSSVWSNHGRLVSTGEPNHGVVVERPGNDGTEV